MSVMAAKKSNRRQFLSGEAAINAIGDVRVGSDKLDNPTRANSRSILLEFARKAMACQFQIYINSGQYRTGPDASIHGLDLVDLLEDQLTVYRNHSEISQINENAAETDITVEPFLFDLLLRAIGIHQITGGAFDITSGPLTRLWGFHRREGNFPPQNEIDETLELIGSHQIELNSEQRTIRFHRSGLEINLGAIGKGYALDRCASLMDYDEQVEHFLIHGGHSSVLGRGDKGWRPKSKKQQSPPEKNDSAETSRETQIDLEQIDLEQVDQAQNAPIVKDELSNREGWSVALRHPLRTDQRLAEIWLFDEALGTSGAANQFFYHRGKRYGHILDPRTGWPAEGTLSATVITKNAETADALATGCYVMGLEQVQQFHQEHPEHGIIMVTPGKRAGQNELHTFGMDDRKWQVLMDKI